MLKCCDQNHNNDNNQCIFHFIKNEQTNEEEPLYGTQLFRNLKKNIW